MIRNILQMGYILALSRHEEDNLRYSEIEASLNLTFLPKLQDANFLLIIIKSKNKSE